MATARRRGDSSEDIQPNETQLESELTTSEARVAGIVAAFERNGLAYVVVGGQAASVTGGRPASADLDCVVDHDRTNLSRLAQALSEVGARLRVTGLDDTRSKGLDLPIGAESLGRLDRSTWRTDMGTLDVLSHVTDSAGDRLDYRDLMGRARATPIAGTIVRAVLVEAPDIEWSDGRPVFEPGEPDEAIDSDPTAE